MVISNGNPYFKRQIYDSSNSNANEEIPYDDPHHRPHYRRQHQRSIIKFQYLMDALFQAIILQNQISTIIKDECLDNSKMKSYFENANIVKSTNANFECLMRISGTAVSKSKKRNIIGKRKMNIAIDSFINELSLYREGFYREKECVDYEVFTGYFDGLIKKGVDLSCVNQLIIKKSNE